MDKICAICEDTEHTGDCLIPDAPWASPEPLEACHYCGDKRTDHTHGKHMMPFCVDKQCQSKFWDSVERMSMEEYRE